jgi:hypothetical protein
VGGWMAPERGGLRRAEEGTAADGRTKARVVRPAAGALTSGWGRVQDNSRTSWFETY